MSYKNYFGQNYTNNPLITIQDYKKALTEGMDKKDAVYVTRALDMETAYNENHSNKTQLENINKQVINKIKEALYKMLTRENRLELYENSIKFLKTRIKLDQSGFTEDIFQH